MTSVRARLRSIVHWWNLRLDRLDPVAGLLVGVGIAWLVVARDTDWSRLFVESDAKDFFVATATVAGALLGLLVTALAVLADHLSAERVGARLTTNHRGTFVNVFVRTTGWLGLVTVLGLAALLVSGACTRQWLLAALVVGLTVSFVMIARSISLLRAVVAAAINPGEEADK